MAYQSTLLLALLFITTASLTHGLTINGTNIAQVRVIGLLDCSVNGPGIGGVNVTLSCDGGTTSLSQAVTDPSGFFEVVLKTLDGILYDSSSCGVVVRLPVASCTVSPPIGTLEAIPALIGVVESAVGAVARFDSYLTAEI